MGTYGGTNGNDAFTAVKEASSIDPLFRVWKSWTMYGGEGNDTLIGGPLNDYLYGDNGDYGNGNDYLYGGDGNDGLVGNGGNDSLYGGDGNDVLLGDNDNDYLYGSFGNDYLRGDDGNDKLLGGDGDDNLQGQSFFNSADYDTLTGGSGADIFEIAIAIDVDSGLVPGYQGASYATITDFKWWEGDKIRVGGDIGTYTLEYSNYSGSSALDTAIFYQGDLIAIVQDITNVNIQI